jgi:hypothetical protein
VLALEGQYKIVLSRAPFLFLVMVALKDTVGRRDIV